MFGFSKLTRSREDRLVRNMKFCSALSRTLSLSEFRIKVQTRTVLPRRFCSHRTPRESSSRDWSSFAKLLKLYRFHRVSISSSGALACSGSGLVITCQRWNMISHPRFHPAIFTYYNDLVGFFI